MLEEKPVLSFDHVSISYGEEDVVREVSFELPRGSTMCIVGESGSGKSTLLKAIHGGEPYLRITHGHITFDGDTDPGTMIGVIPQNPSGSFNPIRSIEKQLREMFASHQLRFEREKVIASFQALGLPDGDKLLAACPWEMSGGMNQRIAIAAATLLAPRLLLCDEVTSALDVTSAAMVAEELLQLKEQGMTVLMVTHHLGLARRLSDYIGIMEKGRMIEMGEAARILEDPQEAYTKALLASVPRIG